MRIAISRTALLLVAVPLLATGCIKQRFITADLWRGDSTYYLAYTEHGAGTAAKVKKCTRHEDNSLACKDQDNLNSVLNK